MSDLFVFPDAVSLIIDYLNPELDVPVAPRVPNPRPDKFVTVARVGGPRRDIVTDRPLITIESWAGSDEDAHDQAQIVRALLHEMPGRSIGGTAVYTVDEASGPQLLPDPLSDQPRYTFLVQIALRGDRITLGS